MFVQDGLTVDRTWETNDGFLAFSARFARTGIQHYDGSQIDPDGEFKDDAGQPRFKAGTLYPVQRDAEEVFAPRAMASFIAKPITNDHPSNGVNPGNWGRLAKGGIGEVLRDGEYARMGGLLTDAAAIADYRSGKRELSGGYQAKLVIGDGVNDKGEAYVARQTMIDGNHVALVDKGRAGPECAIRDAAICAANPHFLDSLTTKTEKPVKTMLIDGLTVDVSNADTAEATIKTLIAARDAATGKVAEAEAKVVAADAAAVAKDAEIASLKQQLADAKLTPAQMREAGKAYALIVDKAKASGVAVTDAMDEAAIMKAVVDKAMPGNTYTDEHVKIAFETLTKDVKPTQGAPVQPLGSPVLHDAATNEQKAWMKASDHNAWRTQAAN